MEAIILDYLIPIVLAVIAAVVTWLGKKVNGYISEEPSAKWLMM